jgi:elongation factor P
MLLATEIKVGMTLKLDDRLYRVLEVIRHAGSGQMQGFIELKLKDLRFGHFSDRRFKTTDKLEEVELTKKVMEYIYSDAESAYFMDPQTYEQVGLSLKAIGEQQKFLKEGMKITVELLGEEAINTQFPKIVELKVASTGPRIREEQDNTMKPAVLENGLEILVPQFIVSGEIVRVDTEKLKYVDRVAVKKI